MKMFGVSSLMSIDTFLQKEHNRRDAYQLLAALYTLPDRSLIERLPRLTEIFAAYTPSASKQLAYLNGNIDIETLVVDYSQLFIGPFQMTAAPYGSIYLESGRQVMSDSTADIVSRYEMVGIEISKDFKDVPDHISAELEFMYFLIYQEIVSLEKRDREIAVGYIEKQRSFLEDHLVVWLPKFAQAVDDNATTDFYKNISKATLQFVQHDLATLNKKIIPEFE